MIYFASTINFQRSGFISRNHSFTLGATLGLLIDISAICYDSVFQVSMYTVQPQAVIVNNVYAY